MGASTSDSPPSAGARLAVEVDRPPTAHPPPTDRSAGSTGVASSARPAAPAPPVAPFATPAGDRDDGEPPDDRLAVETHSAGSPPNRLSSKTGLPPRPPSVAADSAGPDIVLISDPSAEGETIATMLRARGYLVVDTPVALLEARVLSEPASVLIVDVDQAGAFESLEHLRERGADGSFALICIGDPARAAELGARRSSGLCFERPVDFDDIIDRVAAIADPAVDHHTRGTTPPPSYAPRRDSAPPATRASELLADTDLARRDPFDVGALLQTPIEGAAPKLPTQLSPELEELLRHAEQKVLATIDRASSVPSPEEEVDLVLSPELLAVLDEPLEPEEDGEGTGSGLGRNPALEASRTPSPREELGGPNGAHDDVGDAPGGGLTGPRRVARATTPVIEEPHPFDTAAQVVDKHPSTELRAGLALGRHTPVPRPVEPEIQVRAEVDTFDGARSPTPRLSLVALARDEWLGPRAGGSDRAPPPGPIGRPTTPDALRSDPPLAHSPQVGGVDPLQSETEHPIPAVLAEGGAIVALGRAIGRRASGSLAMGSPEGIRRIVLREGDIVTAGSGAADETLVSFLAARGDLDDELAAQLAGRLPPFGRHAGAALIAYGHLGQDDLWPVLRAHAEWVIGRALCAASGTCELEHEPPGRLKAEPSVFGGAAGAEVLVEIVRRVVAPGDALARLGGQDARIDVGGHPVLLGECALRPEEEDVVRNARGQTIRQVLETVTAAAPHDIDDPPALLYALTALDVLRTVAPAATRSSRRGPRDPLDDEAIRQRVRARVALAHDGDYFAVLGLPRSATSYDIRRAYLDLRRDFEPARLLTAATADLADDVRTVVEVIDEAYAILREPHRRERYLRAIEVGPPD